MNFHRMLPESRQQHVHLTGRNRVSRTAGSSAVPLRDLADPDPQLPPQTVIRLLNAVTGKPADHSPEIC